MVRTCSRATGPYVSKEELKIFGKDVFLNHPYMQKGRIQMLKGEFQADCQGCYKPLSEGHHGFRVPYPETLVQLSSSYGETPEDLDANFRKSPIVHKYLTSHEARELEVSLGNTCDLMCVYCNSSFSSLIEKEDRQYGEPEPIKQNPIEENADLVSAFWDWLETDAIKSLVNIHLIGGETLFHPYVHTFFEKLDSAYRKNNPGQLLNINVFTNLNNSTSVKKFLATIKPLHPKLRVKVLFSCEAVGPRAEYIRYGLDWNRAVGNVRQVLTDERTELGFSPTFNLLSLSTAPAFLRFMKDLGKESGRKFFCADNYVAHPSGLSPFILTTDFLPLIEEALTIIREEGNSFLIPESQNSLMTFFTMVRNITLANNRSPGEDIVKQRKGFVQKIHTLKLRRNLNFAATFPEYAEFYKLCESL